MQTFAIVVSLAFTAVAVVMTARAVQQILGTVRLGQPASRSENPGKRTVTLLKESLLHTRMLQWHWVGAMHWFVYAAFLLLSTAVATGYVQLFKPDFALPLIGHFFLFEWASEGIGLLGTIGIIFLAAYRQLNHPRDKGRKSRFFGSTQWQAYFVEAFVLVESAAILFIRGAEYNLGQLDSDHPEDFDRFHFPISEFVGDALFPAGVEGNEGALETTIVVIAMIKVVLAMVWLIVISSNLTMGIAWHRFTAWFNIFFKRESVGRDTDGATTALGGMKPLMNNGKPVTLDDIDDLDEDATLGVGAIEDFSWKGILDFSTCTECGRCQSQCPAWNTDKPLSPKLLITAMRDHAYAKAPYLKAPEGEREALLEGNTALATEVEKPLVGETGGRLDGLEDGEWFYNPANGAAVIDPEVLWNCTSCGACVQQCPVDIEHVDHIMDMRRHQILVESNFPAELNGLFKGLENKGNPWNMSGSARMDWAKDLPFDVKVVGDDIESLDEVDWLFWVGCAGAYEDRAKKTTRAVAELLDMAGVTFGVLGNGETCTGDPARRAGNEFVFQGLAQQNVESFKEYKVKKVVSTCAHCFNTLKNEYKEFGVELEVVHHTQLLNRLVREGKLTPVKDGAGAHKRSITYHDPCYIGRHNGVYSPPRELLQVLPGAEYVEMERANERSFCCGAGGARMWMEENLGERININRTTEAVGTGADQIAVGCPFCRVMLSDGLTMKQSKGEAREEVEVLDVAQMLLASVKGEQATKLAPGQGAPAAPAAKAAPTKAAPAGDTDVATKAEPEAGDVTITEDTVTETADAGPAAKASGGSSLFDDASSMLDDEPAAKAAPAEKTEDKAEEKGGSLFDDASSMFDEPAEKTADEPAEPEAKQAAPAEESLSGGGSLFDLGGDDAPADEKPAQKPAEAKAEPAEAKPAQADPEPSTDLGSGGSLFDLTADEPAPAGEAPKAEATEAPQAEAPKAEAEASAPKESVDLSGGGSLFDIPADEPAPASSEAAAAPTEAPAEDESAAEAPTETEPEEKAEDKAESKAPAAEKPAAPAVDLDAAGSLFDFAAPENAPAPATPAAPETPAAQEQVEAPAEQTSEEPAEAAEPESAARSTEEDQSGDEAPAGDEADQPADDASQPAEAAEAEPAAEPEPAAEEKPKPVSSGEAHQPRTDADIDGAESLFDL
ncbi:MAG: Fe-S cluster protein [Nocardioides sp.]|nr:Fe-S cluster protein [Nocardioides sp.]